MNEQNLGSLLFSAAKETLPGVYHAMSWEQELPEDFIDQLVEKARNNPNRKARLCLHPSPDELLQITYLAFCRPYSDKTHSHPHRTEVLIPVKGQAKHTTFDRTGKALNCKVIGGKFPAAISTAQGVWHAIEVLTSSFVMIEIGTGPFTKDSTIFL